MFEVIGSSGLASELFYQLSLPAQNAELERMQLLVQQNASAPEKYQFSYSLIDQRQNNLFHYAAKNNHPEMFTILIENIKEEIEKEVKHEGEQLDALLNIIHAKNTDGHTPLTLACQEGNAEIIKVLLEYHLAIGLIELSTIMKEKKFEFGQFGSAVVIGSGITREYPGFELAICVLEDFIVEIEPDYPNNKHLLLLCFDMGKKRIEEIKDWDLENTPEKNALLEFCQRLDFLAPGSLRRLSTRAYAKMVAQGAEEIAENIPDALEDQIKEEIEKYPLSVEVNNLILFLDNQLRPFLKSLEENTQLEAVIENYQCANKAFEGSPKILFALILIGMLIYGLTDIKRMAEKDPDFWSRRHAIIDPWRYIIDVICAALGGIALFVFGGAFFLRIYCRGEEICGERDTSQFAFPRSELGQEDQDKIAAIQESLDKFVVEGTISDGLVQAFSGANNLRDLKKATGDIIEECKFFIDQNFSKGSFFYRDKSPFLLFEGNKTHGDSAEERIIVGVSTSSSSDFTDSSEEESGDSLLNPESSEGGFPLHKVVIN